MTDDVKKIIVIGASAGGMQATAQLLSKLNPELDVAVFVVLHIAKHAMGKVISQYMQKHTQMPCSIAVDGEPIASRHVYLAPPDRHLIIKQGKMLINDGPSENRWRPSIDVLFRSAAVAYDSGVIGIILSGMLDDGTSGMGAIKKCGGTCIVQEPDEAEFPDMPNNVLNHVDVNYRVPIADMGYIIQDIVAQHPVMALHDIPQEIRMEADITERLGASIDDLKKIGTHTVFTCPDCGGGLWQINNDSIRRYRCHTGHVFNESILLSTQAKALEESIWVSIRMLEERRNLLLTVAQHKKDDAMRNEKIKRAEAMNTHISSLRTALLAIQQQYTEE
jgi:two-component system, chemotaxis family, protein-glutamate methylesterase/glutaminase